MGKVYTGDDVDLSPLSGKRIHVVGYGSQGRAQALNLKDSGLSVRVVVREGSSAERACSDGLEVVPLTQASEADVIQILVPDMSQPALYEEHLAPRLDGQTLMFSHGFNVHYGAIEPPPESAVVMVAPKAPGPAVRETYTRGFGVPCLVAVAQDPKGDALATALAYAHALGCTRAGAIETTFAEETETDLFGEQAVLCGGVTELVRQGFETLVEAGYQPEVAYFECLHELKLIVDLLYEGGFERLHRDVSETASFGDLTRGPQVISGSVRQAMRQTLAEVRDGTFAREWTSEVRSGGERFQSLLREDLQHPIETVGRELRSMMRGAGP